MIDQFESMYSKNDDLWKFMERTVVLKENLERNILRYF